jgi:Homeodomain-like domain
MDRIASRAARESKAMTRQEVIKKAIEGAINWVQASDILRLSPRHLRRLRERYENFGMPGLHDRRAGWTRPPRIPAKVVDEVCRLKRDVYPDFSVRHFHEFAVARHGVKVSYTWVKEILQMHGLVQKAPGRGAYRRKRERRPMRGMLLHLDGSTHTWIPDLPQQDLIVMLDDADGRILFARFFEEEGTLSTLVALKHVFVRWGRFSELYTDRGSHFCRTSKAGQAPDEEQTGQVARVLKALGIRHILARSPEARGRSERAFGTIQGRLPQELRLAGVRSYEAANEYLDNAFVPAFNRRFTVTPAQPESAFTSLAGIDLELLLTAHYPRIVRNDNTVVLYRVVLQLPASRDRIHFARCPVVVHEFLDETLGVSFQGRLLARYDLGGTPLPRGRRQQDAA